MVIILARDPQTVQKKQKNAIIEEVEEPETTKIAMQNPSIAATPKVRELPRNPVRHLRSNTLPFTMTVRTWSVNQTVWGKSSTKWMGSYHNAKEVLCGSTKFCFFDKC